MTYKEYIAATVEKFQVTTKDVELILCNQGSLIPDPEAQVNVRTAKMAICKEIATILPLANISEGGYSVSWNWEALKFWYNATCTELGLFNYGKPQIKNKSMVW